MTCWNSSSVRYPKIAGTLWLPRSPLTSARLNRMGAESALRDHELGQIHHGIAPGKSFRTPENLVPRRHKRTRIVPEPAGRIHMKALRPGSHEHPGNMKEEGTPCESIVRGLPGSWGGKPKASLASDRAAMPFPRRSCHCSRTLTGIFTVIDHDFQGL